MFNDPGTNLSMPRARSVAFVVLILGGASLLAAGCAGPGTDADSVPAAGSATESPGSATASAGVDDELGFLRDREVFLPQFAGGADGSMYVVWRQPAEGRGGDLYVSRRSDRGTFAPPVQINDIPGTVGGGSLDEGRPAIAIGDDGLIGVAWTARGSDIRAAISHDGGASFGASLVLNSDEGAGAYRGFVDLDVDSSGVAHAAWIDGRFAPRGAEEPAELFYARIEDGDVTEINLTEAQVESICGCCRIDVDVRPDDRLVIAFRNTLNGHRDIYRIEAGSDRVFAEPRRVGPEMWELNGCPVIGPLNVGLATLWSEASTGKRRILAAADTSGGYTVVIEDADDWAIERPPRLIVGTEGGETHLLLPGRPSGKILRGTGTEWTVVGEAPRWAMSAALIDGNLVFLGDIDGELHAESRPYDY